jgi:hypothetical protein
VAAILTEEFLCFPQSLQADAGIVFQIMAWPLLCMSFPVHYSYLVVSFDDIAYSLSCWQPR